MLQIRRVLQIVCFGKGTAVLSHVNTNLVLVGRTMRAHICCLQHIYLHKRCSFAHVLGKSSEFINGNLTTDSSIWWCHNDQHIKYCFRGSLCMIASVSPFVPLMYCNTFSRIVRDNVWSEGSWLTGKGVRKLMCVVVMNSVRYLECRYCSSLSTVWSNHQIRAVYERYKYICLENLRRYLVSWEILSLIHIAVDIRSQDSRGIQKTLCPK